METLVTQLCLVHNSHAPEMCICIGDDLELSVPGGPVAPALPTFKCSLLAEYPPGLFQSQALFVGSAHALAPLVVA